MDEDFSFNIVVGFGSLIRVLLRYPILPFLSAVRGMNRIPFSDDHSESTGVHYGEKNSCVACIARKKLVGEQEKGRMIWTWKTCQKAKGRISLGVWCSHVF